MWMEIEKHAPTEYLAKYHTVREMMEETEQAGTHTQHKH